MATAKEFRRAIASCAEDAVKYHPTDSQMDRADRHACFVAMLAGWMKRDEPQVYADLKRVLDPKTQSAAGGGA